MIKQIGLFIRKFFSVKGVFAILATILLFMRIIPDWYFLLAWTLFLGLRQVDKALTIMDQVKISTKAIDLGQVVNLGTELIQAPKKDL